MPRRKEKTVIRNGIEYYYKSIRDERGKYITVYGRTIAERDEKVKKREAEIRLRRKIKEFPTFSERATEWLSDKSKDLKRNTYNNYEQIIRTHFIPVLGNKRLIDITGEDIKAAMAVAEAQSASVYRKASMLIKQIFADALTCDLIQVDPTTKHTFKRVRHEKEDTGEEYLTDARVSTLLAAVKDIYPLETSLGWDFMPDCGARNLWHSNGTALISMRTLRRSRLRVHVFSATIVRRFPM